MNVAAGVWPEAADAGSPGRGARSLLSEGTTPTVTGRRCHTVSTDNGVPLVPNQRSLVLAAVPALEADVNVGLSRRASCRSP